MTNPITIARRELASFIGTLVPQLPIFPSPPTNISAPCVVISFRESQQTGSGLWHQFLRVTLIGPAGDNEAAIASLEEMIWSIASEVSSHYKTKIEWKVPTVLTANEQVYLSTSFDIVIDIS
jgi:hypothetical protein